VEPRDRVRLAGRDPRTDLDGDGEDDRYVLDEVPNPRYSADEAAERDDVENDGLIDVVRTDSAGVRFDVAAVQCRHNADNANPFGPEPVEADE
jgi:hypothetical protein